MVVANLVFLSTTAIEMVMIIKVSSVINTSAFFDQLLIIHNSCRMAITFYGLDTAGRNSFLGLDQGVNSCLSLHRISFSIS